MKPINPNNGYMTSDDDTFPIIAAMRKTRVKTGGIREADKMITSERRTSTQKDVMGLDNENPQSVKSNQDIESSQGKLVFSSRELQYLDDEARNELES
ncbi:hypothetical protein TruAng_007998 [Truncatella angustata]|nr:hypothetical protein TruAng_007998 [Truncatella angustata]